MSRTHKDTRTDLVIELEKLKFDDENRKTMLAQVIAEAKAGEFHDYKNQKYVEGKTVLVSYLWALGQDTLVQRVIDGEFDELADEEDLAEMRRTLPEAMWDTLGLRPGQSDLSKVKGRDNGN